MTVNTVDSIAEFDTNGVTTNFPFYFKFLANEDLVVTYIDPLGISTTLSLGTNYTVNGAGNDQGGSIVTTGALAGPGQLTVSREMEAFQQTSLRNQGKFLAETHEDVFDKLTMLIQQGLSTFKRALTRPFGRDYFDAENRLIKNVKDPVDSQDAATKSYLLAYVNSILAVGQGPVNNAVNVLYAPPAGVTRSVASKLQEFISVKDYGAKCDGVTDDTAACQAAINYLKSVGGGVLRFNGGTIRLTAPLTLADCSIVCVGDGIDVTIIRCLHSGNGFSFTDSSAVSNPIHRYVFVGMTIAKDGIGGRGISVSRTVLSSNPTIPSLLIRDVMCRGYIDIGGQYWDIGIYELNGGAPTIEDVSVIANGPAMTCGILLDNASNASRYNIKLDGINIQGGVTGLRVNGHAENFRLTNYEIVGQGTCIYLDGSTTAIPGGLNPVAVIGNGHANAKTYTIRAVNWSVVCIENTDTYSGVGTGDTDGSNILINNSKFVSVIGGKVGTGSGNNRSGIDLQGATDVVINTIIEGFKTGGIILSGVCDRINVSGIITNSAGFPTASGIYVGSTGCRINTGVLTIENCTVGLNSPQSSDNSIISGVTFKNCGTDIIWNGSNYVVGDIQSSNVPPRLTLTGTGFHRKIRLGVVVDPPSIANGARTTVLVTVAGALFGDSVSVAAPYDISDMTITAFVQNTNTVGLYFQNNSGSTKDLASGTWTFTLER